MKDPKEVQEMRQQLADVRKTARGVKDSWRNLRALPKSGVYADITEARMSEYDSLHPAPTSDDTTAKQPRK